MTFRKRLLLLQLLTVVLTTLLLGGGSHLLVVSALEDLQGRHLVHLAREGAQVISSVLQERARQMEGLDMSSFHQRYDDQPSEKHFLKYFRELPVEFPAVSLLDEEGREIVKLVKGQANLDYSNYQYEPVVQRSRRQPNSLQVGIKVQDPQFGWPSVRLAYTYVSNSGDDFLGTLLLTLPLADFEQRLVRVAQDDDISLSLLSGERELLTFNRHEMAFQTLPFISAQTARRHQFFGTDLVLLSQPVVDSDWQVMASVPWQVYRTEIRRIRLLSLGVGLLVTLLGAFCAWKLATLLTRNIDQLIEFAERVGQGDYRHQLPLNSSKEFNRLNHAFNQMVIDLDSHRRSRDSFQKIIETVMDPLIVTDREGLIVQVNQAVLELLHCDPAQINHRPLADFFPEAPSVLRRSQFAAGLLCGPVSNLETHIRGCQGRDVAILFSSSPCGEESQEFGVVCILKDITELLAVRDSREKALILAEESRRRIDVLLRSVPDGLVVTDLQGNIQLINDPAERMLGADVESQVLGIARQLLEETGAIGRTVDIPLAQGAGGQIRVVQAHASEIYDRKDQVRGLVMLLRDVSLERSMDQMKNEFISTAAHELRTPLTAILGYSELMLEPTNQDRFSKEEQRDFLQEILERAETLARLIDDLLSISRMESGQPLALEVSNADITGLVTRVVQQFRLTAQGYRFDLELTGDKVVLALDSGRIQQVLENLLNNAVKYSSKKEPILIRGRRVEGQYTLSVEDQGIGMLPEQVEQIFEKFYRVDYSNTKTSGLGIGMSIVKQIVDGHGGRITVSSTIDVGTRVELSLPLPGSTGV
ncbi:MAG: ATP-binding protein [Geopsychrobacter sp.]|nr:ATP-binding protein [Geopsychrobacter sp.]